jgi:hypothetical protein
VYDPYVLAHEGWCGRACPRGVRLGGAPVRSWLAGSSAASESAQLLLIRDSFSANGNCSPFRVLPTVWVEIPMAGTNANRNVMTGGG